MVCSQAATKTSRAWSALLADESRDGSLSSIRACASAPLQKDQGQVDDPPPAADGTQGLNTPVGSPQVLLEVKVIGIWPGFDQKGITTFC